MPRISGFVAAFAAFALLLAPLPAGRSEGVCVDATETRAGTLKWAVLNVVFSASSATATSTVDLEPVGDGCVAVHVHCVAQAADGSRLSVDVHPTGGSYVANYRGLFTMDVGTGLCSGVRHFEGTNGALRVLFDG